MSSLIISGGLIVTMDPQHRTFFGDILVVDNRIAALGEVPHHPEAKVISAQGKLVLPGLIQAHVHLVQSLFRGLANDMTTWEWLFKVILPLEGCHDADSMYDSARLGLAEMIRSGTSTIVDMGAVWHIDSLFNAISESGIRAQSGLCLMDHPEAFPALHQETDRALAGASSVFDRWDRHDGGRIRCSFLPRGMASTTQDLWHELGRLAGERQANIHVHANESQAEIEAAGRRWGDRPVATLGALGVAGPNLQAAHCVHLEAREMSILRENHVKVVHCPGSNAKLGSGIAPVVEMLEQGISVSLGSDAAPCNDNLDLFAEMRLSGLLQKLRLGPRALPAAQILELATMGGATTMGLEREIGSLEVGKKADLIVVGGSALHANPWEPSSIENLLVYGFHGDDVETTIVDGRVLMRDRVLTSLPGDEILARARRSRQRVLQRAGVI